MGHLRAVPKRTDDVIMEVGLEMGGCFMMIGRAGGRLRPCNFNLMSFMAMENSSLSILPSLSMSARALRERERECPLECFTSVS